MPPVEAIEAPKGKFSAWIWFKRKFSLTCCGCGLTHDFEVRLDGRKFMMRIRENIRATVATRRQTKYEKE